MNDNGKNKAEGRQRLIIAVATTAIAAVGAIATILYNQQQTRFQEIETVERFFPHLVSTDNRLNEMARLTVKSLLTDPKLADDLIKASVKVTTERAATQAELTPAELAEIRPTGVTQAQGWVYLGEYSFAEKTWNTRYFDFEVGALPKDLQGETLKVREETGALNVRRGMPTPDGRFPGVTDVLKPRSKVTIDEVRPWQQTGFMWARISYVPQRK